MKHLIAILMVIVLLGCKTSGPIIQRHRVKKIGSQELKALVDKNAFDCATLSFRSAVKLHTGKSDKQFKATVRVQKDSIIWMSISPLLGIEAVRVMATVDSVKILNRIKKTCFLGNYDLLASQYNVAVDFSLLQNLIFGNTIGLDELSRIRTSVTDTSYLVSSFKARRVLKKIDKEKPRRKDDIIVIHWIEPDSFRVQKISMFDFVDNNSMLVHHDGFSFFNQLLLPLETSVDLDGRAQMNLTFDKSSVSVNEVLRFPFKIPGKYDLVQ